MAAALAAGASATALPPPPLDAALALAEFEAGLDGLAENDLVDEAEVDSIIRETVLHAIGDMPWSDAKVCAERLFWVLAVLRGVGVPLYLSLLTCGLFNLCLLHDSSAAFPHAIHADVAAFPPRCPPTRALTRRSAPGPAR